jgi:hypothetical protein
MATTKQPTAFTLYRCTNPKTTCDYPFLAPADDGSVLLTLGANTVCLECNIPEQLSGWLKHDFAVTGTTLTFDVSTVQQFVRAAFGDEAEFLLMHFDQGLNPSGVEFSLVAQKTAEEGPEFLVEGRGLYRRVNRFPKWNRAVTPAEHALLEVFTAMATELATEHRTALSTPSPLSRRLPAAYQPLNEREDNSDENEA